MTWLRFDFPRGEIRSPDIHDVFNASFDKHRIIGAALYVEKIDPYCDWTYYLTPEAAEAIPEIGERFHGVPCEEPPPKMMGIVTDNPGQYKERYEYNWERDRRKT